MSYTFSVKQNQFFLYSHRNGLNLLDNLKQKHVIHVLGQCTVSPAPWMSHLAPSLQVPAKEYSQPSGKKKVNSIEEKKIHPPRPGIEPGSSA